MASGQRHIIDCLQVELEVHNPDTAHKLQEKVSTVLREDLEPMLEILFDKVPEDETIVVDQLVLDLGSFSESDLTSAFRDQMPEQIRTKLSKWKRRDQKFGDGVLHYAKHKLYFETFSHFLKTGTYPWFVSPYTEDAVLLDPEQTCRILLKEREEDFVNFIKKWVNSSEIRKRLIGLLDEDLFGELADHLNADQLSGDVDRALEVLDKHGADRKLLEFAGKDVRLAVSAGTTSPKEVLRIFLKSFLESDEIRQLQKSLFQSSKEMKSLQGGLLVTALKELSGLLRLRQLLKEGNIYPTGLSGALTYIPETGEVKKYLKKILNSGLDTGELELIQYEVKTSLQNRIKLALIESQAEDQIQKGGSEKNDFYVTNAGLILLWPFLPSFFRRLELTGDRDFIDEKSRFKAIHILQYLASGEYKTFEYVMVLNKVLCGHPVNRPIPAKMEFSAYEIETADLLIESVIEQWKALKNTSPEGLRTSFFQRNGRLIKYEEKWELKVENKGFDVLLDKLPWGISVARLPWMNKPVYADWR